MCSGLINDPSFNYSFMASSVCMESNNDIAHQEMKFKEEKALWKNRPIELKNHDSGLLGLQEEMKIFVLLLTLYVFN